MTRLARTAAAVAAVGLTLLASTPAQADTIRDAQWHLGFMHIAEAHRYSQGDGVIVGVVDTGVDATHPDLSGAVLPGTDLTAAGDGHRDLDGHGTTMAGLIAGRGHGGSNGILGIAPKAKILPVRDSVTGHSVADVQESGGITWAVQHGAKVISLSWVSDDTPELQDEIRQAIAADVVIVAGVGNRPNDTQVRYPAAYDGVLAVGAVDQHGNHAEVSVTGDKVAITAPGVDIASTALYQTSAKSTGTSDATAIVAGVAALVRAKYPQLSAQEVIHRLTATADDKGAPGHDPVYGYGIVDPVAALTADVAPLPVTPSAKASPSAGPDAGASATTGSGSNHVAAFVAIGLGLLLLAVVVVAWVVFGRRRRTAAD